LQVAEREQALLAEYVDDTSSYGSGNSSEGFVATSPVPVTATGCDDLSTLLSGIAALARGQGIVLEKLSFLEKIVGTVQSDMTWVRDDMKAVHDAMDRFGDFVCDVQDAAGEDNRLKEREFRDGSPLLAWKGKEHVVDLPQANNATNEHGEEQHGGDGATDRHATRQERGNNTVETPPDVGNQDLMTNSLALIETGRRDWGYEPPASPGMGSPQCQQKRVSIEKEPLEQESQQIEMPAESTQAPRIKPPWGMWSNYSTAVKDWPAATVGGDETEEGWVSAKKGRWDLTEYRSDNAATANAQLVEAHRILNLNMLSEKGGLEGTTSAGVETAASACTNNAVNSTCNGAWRGTARGKKAPVVQPRYHAAVRVVI
jgi:hypothetical protein